jgi:FemAB-related protein (PEP-CTERM system-associated)
LTPPVSLGFTAPQVQRSITVRVHEGPEATAHVPRLESFASRGARVPLSRHPGWLAVLARALGHTPWCLEAVEDGKTVGLLPLAQVRSLLFGHALVGLPYLNYGGVQADDDQVARALLDRAVELADRLRVDYLELRHTTAVDHPKMLATKTDKVHMRLELPASPGKLWDQVPSKVRNQVRKGQKNGLTVSWGRQDLLREFDAVFSHNMRDLGTPNYGRALFAEALARFPGRSEICIVRTGDLAVAAGFLLHGWGVTEVPSASSLRKYNPTCANMLLYWNLLERATERKQGVFDFGRSSRDSTTYRFKQQWGARPTAAEWQCYPRTGSWDELRPQSTHYGRLVRIWQRLPLPLTRLLGPRIVRGIP